MTHIEHSYSVKRATACAAWHISFGGLCLNCGWHPVDYAVIVPKVMTGKR